MKIFAESERLQFREILPSDADGMFKMDSDPEVHQYLGNNPVKSKEQIVEAILFIRQQYIDNGIGRWAIVDKKTNDFIGWAGLKYVTELTNNHQNYYDLGYRLRKKYWGQGIGTESAIASLQYAFDTLQAKEVFAMVDCDNEGSNNILRKVRFELIETFDMDGVLHNWYRIERGNVALH